MNLLEEIKRLRELAGNRDITDAYVGFNFRLVGEAHCDALEKAIEVLKLVAPFEKHLGGFNATYNRTTVEFNYPGKPKAAALLKEWGVE